MAERKQYDYRVPNLNDELNKVYEVKVESRFNRDLVNPSGTTAHGHIVIETGKALVTATAGGLAFGTVTITANGKYTYGLNAQAIPFGSSNTKFYTVGVVSLDNTGVEFRLQRIDFDAASGTFPASGVQILYTYIGSD